MQPNDIRVRIFLKVLGDKGITPEIIRHVSNNSEAMEQITQVMLLASQGDDAQGTPLSEVFGRDAGNPMSARVLTALGRARIRTLEELVLRSADELEIFVRGIGPVGVQYIQDSLARCGYTLANT
jgi:hypothetical protein